MKQNPGKSPIVSLFLTSGWRNTGLERPCWVAWLHVATWLECGKPKPEPSLLLVSVHPSHLCPMCLFLLEQGLRPPFTCVKHGGGEIFLFFGIAGSTVSVTSSQKSNLYSEMNVCSPPSPGLCSAQGPTHQSTRHRARRAGMKIMDAIWIFTFKFNTFLLNSWSNVCIVYILLNINVLPWK